jgi:hypothetical protein
MLLLLDPPHHHADVGLIDEKSGLGIPRMFAHPAVGKVSLGDADVNWECHDCHPGLNEDIVGTASKFAFMGHGFVPDVAERNSENLCPPLHYIVRLHPGSAG